MWLRSCDVDILLPGLEIYLSIREYGFLLSCPSRGYPRNELAKTIYVLYEIWHQLIPKSRLAGVATETNI